MGYGQRNEDADTKTFSIRDTFYNGSRKCKEYVYGKWE